VLAAAALFAAAGAWPAPDINETVYLTKARHHADPAWGRGDFFLETPDAHGVFFAAMGPLAAAVPLETAAWIGRAIGWLAMAWGFHRAIVPVVAGTWSRIVAAALFAIAVRFTTAAGEWVIGGCEAKVFSWALVLAGVGEVGRGRFGPAWCLCGAAAALHPVVGGWAMIAVAAVWLVDRLQGGAAGMSLCAGLWAVAGLLLASCGVVPVLGLSAGVDAATRAAANAIYVTERLPHHLLPRSFAAGLVPRHLLAIAVWWLLHRLVPRTPARLRLARLVGSTLAFSLIGWIASLAELFVPAAAHAILRFYWFRLADVMVPLALAATVAAVLTDDRACTLVVPLRPVIVRALAVGLLGLSVVAESAHWPLPGRVGLAPRVDARVDPVAWVDVCEWVRDHAPADACFLTPRGEESFTWRTGRGEVVSWKNSPQDARSLVEWRRRYTDCYSRDGGLVNMEVSTAAFGADRLLEVAARYGADHAIVPLVTCGLEALPFPRLYENAAYAVLELPPLTAGARPGDQP